MENESSGITTGAAGTVAGDLVGALAKIQAAIGVIGKGRDSDAGYKFRGIDDVIAAIHPLMVEHELLCIPSIEDIDYLGKNQKAYKGVLQPGAFDIVKVRLRFLFVGPDGSTLSIPFVMLAQNTAVDKAVGTAQSYATRYMLTGALTIPSWGDDLDPEAQEDRRELDQQQGYDRETRPNRKSERRGSANDEQRIRLADLVKAISDAPDEVTEDLVLARANAMRPTRVKEEFKTLRVVVVQEPTLARTLLELVDTGQIMNPEAEPFDTAADPEPWRQIYAELADAATAYKEAADDPDYTAALLVSEVEQAAGIKVEGGLEGLARDHPAHARDKITELRSRVEGATDNAD